MSKGECPMASGDELSKKLKRKLILSKFARDRRDIILDTIESDKVFKSIAEELLDDISEEELEKAINDLALFIKVNGTKELRKLSEFIPDINDVDC